MKPRAALASVPPTHDARFVGQGEKFLRSTAKAVWCRREALLRIRTLGLARGQTLPNEIGFALRFGLGAFLGGKERVLNLNASDRL